MALVPYTSTSPPPTRPLLCVDHISRGRAVYGTLDATPTSTADPPTAALLAAYISTQ